MNRIETLRRIGMAAMLGPMLLILAVGASTWIALPAAGCIAVGIGLIAWCQMVQDHTPPQP